ncbi:MAG: lipopolysaccharide biosynthesis protein [Aminipila sp.]
MQEGKTLIKNTAIYAIATFGSRVLSFLIVPLYTFYLSPAEMGTYDLVITTITLLVPFLTFQMSDGIYRWLLDSRQNKEQVIGTGLKVCGINMVIFIVLYIIISSFIHIPFSVYSILLLLLYAIVPVIQQVVRGLNKNKLFAFSGVMLTVIFLASNILFVIVFRQGIEGMLLSQISAYAITLLFLLWRCPTILSSLNVKSVPGLSYDMLKYSLPLIPNVVSWWTINASNRYVILVTLGAAANGIFAISMKFPTLIQMVTSIFYLAWQEAAIKQSERGEDPEFTSKVFHMYSRFLLLFSAVAIPLTRIFVIKYMEINYANAWRYSSFLYLGMVYSALASFLGTGYQASKKTKGALLTTIWAALLSLAISIALISQVGLYAISLSVFGSYVFLFLIRTKDCSKLMTLRIKWKELFILTAYALSIAILCLYVNTVVNALLGIIVCIVFFIVQRKEISGLFVSIRNKLYYSKRKGSSD